MHPKRRFVRSFRQLEKKSLFCQPITSAKPIYPSKTMGGIILRLRLCRSHSSQGRGWSHNNNTVSQKIIPIGRIVGVDAGDVVMKRCCRVSRVMNAASG